MTERQLTRLDAQRPFTLVSPSSDSDWEAFIVLWGGAESDTSPLRSLIRTARSRGCRSVVVENGYADLDQASEAEFWSKEFPLPHTDVHRLHFFSSAIDEHELPIRRHDGYLGYAIIARPLGRLIRALMRPPPCMASSTGLGFQTDLDLENCAHCEDSAAATSGTSDGMLTGAHETVELFGLDYPLVGVPWCGQAAWHLQCGHAVAWTCLYTGYLNGRAPRSTLKDVVDASSTLVDVQRAVSATGTNLFQLQQIFSDREMPALFYEISDVIADPRLHLGGVRQPSSAVSPEDQAIFGVVCNYLNSGFPVVAATDEHALIVLGWRRTGHSDGRIELLVSDSDDLYATLDSPRDHGWKHLMIPLPPSVVLSGETVQAEVHSSLGDIRACVEQALDTVPSEMEEAAAEVQELFDSGRLSLRLQLKQRQEYKSAVVQDEGLRGRSVAEALAMLRLPGWVWVVEVQDRVARSKDQPCVLAEAVFDTTSPDDSSHQCTFSMGPVTWCNWPYDRRAMPKPLVTIAETRLEEGQVSWHSQINRVRQRPPLLVSAAAEGEKDAA